MLQPIRFPRSSLPPDPVQIQSRLFAASPDADPVGGDRTASRSLGVGLREAQTDPQEAPLRSRSGRGVSSQALCFPGDDITAVPWQRPRCDEGPLLLLSSQLPAPLPVLQNLRRAVLPVCGLRPLARVAPVGGAALQTSALLPPDGAAPHRQYAAAEAQLALPEPGGRRHRTPGAWRWRPEGIRYLAAGRGEPAPGAVRRPQRRRDGGRHRRGEPKRRRQRNHRLRPGGRGGADVAGGGAGFGPGERASRALAGPERVRFHVGRSGGMLTPPPTPARRRRRRRRGNDRQRERRLSLPFLFFSVLPSRSIK